MGLGRRSLLIVLCAALVVGLPVLLFQDVLDYEFLNYDDDIYVTGNPVVHSLHPRHIWAMFSEGYYRSYQPLTLLSHAIDYAVWGGHPGGHHLTSLLLHAVNGLMLMGLALLVLRRLPSLAHTMGPQPGTGSWWIPVAASTMAALFFAIHPLRVESVAWISGRKDLLMTFFLIPSCVAYVLAKTGRQRRRRIFWYWASLGLFVCGVLAKTVAGVLPLALLSLDLLLVPRSRWKADAPAMLWSKIPYVGMSLVLGIVAIAVGGGHTASRFVRDLSVIEQLLVPAYSLGLYLFKTAVPLGLTPVYTAPSLGILAGVSAVVALCAVWLIRQRRRPAARYVLLAGWAFALFVLPTMVGIVAKTGIQPWADRYVYFASVPLFLLLAGGILMLLHHGKAVNGRFGASVAGAAVAAGLILSGIMAREYLPVWKASEPLWRSVIAASPELSDGYNNLGAVLVGRGEIAEALRCYRSAQERAPGTPGPWYNMGLAHAQVRSLDSAAWYYRAALLRDSAYVDAHTALGTLALSEGNLQEAQRHYEAALAHDPASAKAHHNIGIICYKNGNRAEAARHFERAVAAEPFSTRALLSLGVVCSETGDRARARRLFRDAARLGSPEARQLLAAENESW